MLLQGSIRLADFFMTVLVECVLFVVWTMTVAICDLRSRRVSNLLMFLGLVAGLVCAFTARTPFGTAPAQAVLGAVIGLAVLLPFYLLHLMGAADVKMFAVLGAWCGLSVLFEVWVIASIFAGIHAALLLLITRTRVTALVRRGGPTFELHGYRATPYVTCLSAAALISLATRIIEGVTQ
jgi:prepilin peptidase CpaA